MAMAMASGPPNMTLRKLFGGAMECLLPAAYVDVRWARTNDRQSRAANNFWGMIEVLIASHLAGWDILFPPVVTLRQDRKESPSLD